MKRSTIVPTLAAGLLATSAAFAATQQEAPRLVVVGRGIAKTVPEIASLSFTIRGEGASSDTAARELVRKRAAIVEGLSKLLGDAATVNLGALSILEARDRACDADDDNNRPRLSTGTCGVRGYVAQVSASLRISPVASAGTALGLATRLGASDARANEFSLRDPQEARRRAEAAAVADARTRATAIAAAAGKRLGELISVEDQAAESRGSRNDIVVTAMRRSLSQAVAAPPIIIDLQPEPIETSAAMIVTYGIAP